MRIEGKDKVIQKLNERLGRARAEAIGKVFDQGGQFMFEAMKKDCPIGETRRLVNSGRILFEDWGFTIEWGEGAINASGMHYWYFVEHGTQNSKPQPFIYPNWVQWSRWIMSNIRRT
jgi:HK97 gp10 family phage protein